MSAMTVAERLAAKRGQIAADRAGSTRAYKWKPGKTMFRIIPGTIVGDSFFGERKFGQMWLKSFDGQQKFTIGDRDIIYGEFDPVKDMIFQAMKQAPTQELKDHYKEMLASTQYVFQVLIISVNGAPDPEAPATEPQLVSVSSKQFENILAQFETYTAMDPNYDLAGKDTGHLFVCEKTGTGMTTSYTFLATPQKAPLKQEIIDKQMDLDAWIKNEVDGLQEKAFEFLGKLNGAAGISVDIPAGLLTSSASTTAANTQTADPNNGVSAAAVTTQIEDAVFETVVDASAETATTTASDSPFETEPAATPTPNPTPAEPAASPSAADVQSSEIDDILAGLQ